MQTLKYFIQNPQLELTKQLTEVQVYPNPATDYATFEYVLPEYVEQSTIVITSITGKVIKEFDLEDIRRSNIMGYSCGRNNIYFYALKQGDKTLASGKVSIMK